jgi:hypothetical protein
MEGSKVKTYPLGDRHPQQKYGPLKGIGYEGDPTIRAISNGIKRNPKKGEWYLSGAIPCAYEARNDLTESYWIADIVKVTEHTRYTIERV